MDFDPKPEIVSASSHPKKENTLGFYSLGSTFVQLAEWLSRIAGIAAGSLLVTIIILMLAEIFWRTVVGQSLHFTWEYSSYAMGGVFFLGASYTLHHDSHVRVTAVLETINPAFRFRLEWVCTLIGFLFSVFMTQALFLMAMTSLRGGVVSFTVNQVPLGYPQLMLSIGALVLTLQFLARLFKLTLGSIPDLTTENDLHDE